MGQLLSSPKAPPAHGMLQITTLLPSPSPQHQLLTADKGPSALCMAMRCPRDAAALPRPLRRRGSPRCRTMGEWVVKQGHSHPSKGRVLP